MFSSLTCLFDFYFFIRMERLKFRTASQNTLKAEKNVKSYFFLGALTEQKQQLNPYPVDGDTPF